MAQNKAAVNPALASATTTTPAGSGPSATTTKSHWPLWHPKHAAEQETPDLPATEDAKPIAEAPLLRRRSSITERMADLLPHHHDGHKHVSLSDSGPMVVEEDVKTGHPLAHQNPHWPEEDSWKRQKERDGTGEDPVAPAGVDIVSSY